MVYSTTACLHRAVLSRPGGLGIAGSFIMSLKFGLTWGQLYANAATFLQQLWRDSGGSPRTGERAVLNLGDDLPYGAAFW